MLNVRTTNPKEDLRKLVSLKRNMSIAVAYVTPSGLSLIKNGLEQAIKNGNQVRFLLALDGSGTHPDAVEYLLKLQGLGCQVKHFYDAGKRDRIFHPKLYIAQAARGNRLTFVTGSYNLSRRALERNREHVLWVECQGKEKVGQDALDRFDEFWDAAEHLTQDVVDKYKKVWDERRPEIDEDELCPLGDPSRTEFSWPSEEAAFLMGAICARGRFKNTKPTPSIEISLRFHQQGSNRSRVSTRTRRSQRDALKKIETNAKEVLSEAKVSLGGKQKITMAFPNGHQTFRDIFDAFGRDTESSLGFPQLPTHMRRPLSGKKAMIRNFVQGYAISSALISQNTTMPKRIDPNGPHVVCIYPIKRHQPMFKDMEALINRLGANAKAIAKNPDEPFWTVAVEAGEFEEKIQFGVKSWDESANRAAELNRTSQPGVTPTTTRRSTRTRTVQKSGRRFLQVDHEPTGNTTSFTLPSANSRRRTTARR